MPHEKMGKVGGAETNQGIQAVKEDNQKFVI